MRSIDADFPCEPSVMTDTFVWFLTIWDAGDSCKHFHLLPTESQWCLEEQLRYHWDFLFSQCCRSPCTVIFPSVLALPAELVAKHMYCPESSAVMLSKMSVQEPSGSSMMMWWGSAFTGRPSVWESRSGFKYFSYEDNTTHQEHQSNIVFLTFIPGDLWFGNAGDLTGEFYRLSEFCCAIC